MSHYLTLDVGTTSVKAALVSIDGRLVDAASDSYATSRPAPGVVEHDPSDWWKAVVAAVSILKDRVGLANVRAIGLSGMAATHVLVDAYGAVQRPAILWQDTRAHAEARELAAELACLDHGQVFGARIEMTASLQASRMLWLARHEPEAMKRADAVLGSKDYVALKLTGERATDITSCLAFAHLRDGSLHDDVVRLTHFEPSKLPPRLQPHELVGTVSAEAARATGIALGTPVATGMIDSWCNMLGTGLARPGDAFDVAGTAEVVGLADHPSDALNPPSSAVTRLPFLTGVDAVYGVTQCGTDSLTWFAERFGETERQAAQASNDSSVFERLVAAADTASDVRSDLLFLPFLEGERSPFNDPRMRGAFLGVHRSHGKAHFARAVLEGVAFSVRHVLESSEADATIRAEEIRATSGGSRSRIWNQMKADVTGRVIARLKVADAGSIGAAILAAVAVGDLELGEALEQMIHVEERFEPNPTRNPRYDELFAVYRDAIDATTGLAHRLTRDADGD